MAALLDVSRQFHFNEEAWKNGEYYNANKVPAVGAEVKVSHRAA